MLRHDGVGLSYTREPCHGDVMDSPTSDQANTDRQAICRLGPQEPTSVTFVTFR